MPLELLTLKDLEQFKKELILELKRLLLQEQEPLTKKLLKSPEVCRMLRISPGTLQNLRRNQTLCFRKIGGIIYYHYEDIERLMRGGRC